MDISDGVVKIFENSILAGLLVIGAIASYKILSLLVASAIKTMEQQSESAAQTTEAVKKSQKALETISEKLVDVVEHSDVTQETIEHIIDSIRSVLPDDNPKASACLDRAIDTLRGRK